MQPCPSAALRDPRAGLGDFSGLQSHAKEEAVPEDEEEVRYKEMAQDKELPAGLRQASKNMVEARHPPVIMAPQAAGLFGHICVIFFLYALGAFYLPMALLAVLLYRNYEVLNPSSSWFPS